MIKEYELVPHTADLKMFAYGITMEELFRNALKGMFSIVKPQGKHISYNGDTPVIGKYTIEHHVVVRSFDQETLLVDFLSECLYLSDTNNEAYFDAQFKELTKKEVDATIFGVPTEHFELSEIKAVTYYDLTIEPLEGLWRATIVFDI